MLHLPVDCRRELEAWARESYPEEGCGLLLGRRDGGARVLRVRRGRNINTGRARDRYELDPLDYLAAENEAAAAGLELVGVWHTHPDHPARPSETDREYAWPGWSYLILAVGPTGVTEARSWTLDRERRFREEEVTS
ncbi:MAG: Mov34/MPN/PAD-1 family protein [Pseudomonadota bacterium]